MSKKRMSILFVIYFLVFIGIINYPFLSRMINERIQGSVLMEYQDSGNRVEEAQKEEMLKTATAYNEELALGLLNKSESPFDKPDVNSGFYRELLNLTEEGVMGAVRIPKIEVSLPIYHGTKEDVLQKGAGHLEGSSLPIGGENTHACISAHRGLPTKKMFTYLDRLKAGDIFYIDVLGETLAYEVYETETMLPEEIGPLMIISGADIVTLITCTPYGVNTHRIYVHGKRIPYKEGGETGEIGPETREYWLNRWWIVFTIVLLGWMVLILYWFNRKPQK